MNEPKLHTINKTIKLLKYAKQLENMYKQPKKQKTTISINESREGETIEVKMEKVLQRKEQIHDEAPIIHTERREGVKDAYNVRADRWDAALDAKDKIDKTYTAKREEGAKMKAEKGGKQEKDGGAEPTQGGAESTQK